MWGRRVVGGERWWEPRTCVEWVHIGGCGAGPSGQLSRAPCGWGQRPEELKHLIPASGSRVARHGGCFTFELSGFISCFVQYTTPSPSVLFGRLLRLVAACALRAHPTPPPMSARAPPSRLTFFLPCRIRCLCSAAIVGGTRPQVHRIHLDKEPHGATWGVAVTTRKRGGLAAKEIGIACVKMGCGGSCSGWTWGWMYHGLDRIRGRVRRDRYHLVPARKGCAPPALLVKWEGTVSGRESTANSFRWRGAGTTRLGR